VAELTINSSTSGRCYTTLLDATVQPGPPNRPLTSQNAGWMSVVPGRLGYISIRDKVYWVPKPRAFIPA
jgi:hypothetical protein